MIKLPLLLLLVLFVSGANAQHCGLCFYGYRVSVVVPIDSKGKIIEGLTISIEFADKTIVTNRKLLDRYPPIDSSTYLLAYSFYKKFKADTSNLNSAFLYIENESVSAREQTDQYKVMFYVDNNRSIYHSPCYFIYFKTHILTPPDDAVVAISDPLARYKTLRIPLKDIAKITLHSNHSDMDEIHPTYIKLKRL